MSRTRVGLSLFIPRQRKFGRQKDQKMPAKFQTEKNAKIFQTIKGCTASYGSLLLENRPIAKKNSVTVP